MSGVVIHRIVDADLAAIRAEGFAGIGVHVEAWKIAARDVEPYSVAFLEHIRGVEGPDEQLVGLTGRQKSAGGRIVAIARPQYTVGQVHVEALRKAVAGRIDIDE